jgi:F-type H+-transporting ATPase subunit alpha
MFGSMEGFGCKRIFSIYVGINQNLSKIASLLQLTSDATLFSVISTFSSSPTFLSYLLPLIGISLCERIRDKGIDSMICFDDLSKHSKAYRQLCLCMHKIPSRDAFPADIFNVHSSLLERGGNSKHSSTNMSSSITCFPIIETIQEELSEYIATNVISITDGQFYTNKYLFNNAIRPAIDSGLSVSRIGSNAQCKLMKLLSIGLKNELTLLRSLNINLSNIHSLIYQDHMFVRPIELSCLLIILYSLCVELSIPFTISMIHRFHYLLYGGYT